MSVIDSLMGAGMVSIGGDLPKVEQVPVTESAPPLAGRENMELVSLHEGLAASEVVLMLVNHRSFYHIAPAEIEGRTVIDTRGVWQ